MSNFWIRCHLCFPLTQYNPRPPRRPSLCTRMRSATLKPSWQLSRWLSGPLSGCGASVRKTTSRWGPSVRSLPPSYWRSPTSVEPSASAPTSSGPVAAQTKMAKRWVGPKVNKFLNNLIWPLEQNKISKYDNGKWFTEIFVGAVCFTAGVCTITHIE